MKFRYDDRAWQGLSQEFRDRLAKMPEVKRAALDDIGRYAVGLLMSTYTGTVVLGHKMVTEYRGGYGESITLSVAVGAKRSWATVRITAPYAGAVEGGRGPGPVPIDVIKEWASAKLGLEPDSVDVRRIIFAIRRHGTVATNIATISWSPEGLKGRTLDTFIDNRLEQALAEVGLRSKERHMKV